MMNNHVYLLDANILIALADDQNSNHRQAKTWFLPALPFATCPITQGALIRHYMRTSPSPSIREAMELLRGFTTLPNHRFWPDDASYENLPTKGVVGHKQVTDVYLVMLASQNGGVLATLDKALAAVHAGVLLI